MKTNNDYGNELANLFNIISLNLIGYYILENLINAIRPLTKKEMKSRINFLESKLIQEYSKYNEEIIVP